MGGRSRVAAQLLSGQGFKEVYNLKGGIKGWEGLTAEGPAEEGMALISGDDPPSRIIAVAYAMEEGLRRFYEKRGSEMTDPEAGSLFGKLASVEAIHKRKLLDLLTRLEGRDIAPSELEKEDMDRVLEGGIEPEDLLGRHPSDLTRREAILTLAMMVEAQGLDLYLRYAVRVKDTDARDVLHQLAEEEKGHLSSLGALMETT
jgi:rubrerythrin